MGERLSSSTVARRAPRIEAFGQHYTESIVVHMNAVEPNLIEFAANRSGTNDRLPLTRKAMETLCREAGRWRKKNGKKRAAAIRSFTTASDDLSTAMLEVDAADLTRRRLVNLELKPGTEFLDFIVSEAKASGQGLLEVFTPPTGVAVPWELLREQRTKGDFLGDQLVLFRAPAQPVATPSTVRRSGHPNHSRPPFGYDLQGRPFDSRFGNIPSSARSVKYAEDNKLASAIGKTHDQEEIEALAPLAQRQDISVLDPLERTNLALAGARFHRWAGAPGDVWHFNGHGLDFGIAISVTQAFAITYQQFNSIRFNLSGSVVFLNACYSNVPVLGPHDTLASAIAQDAACVYSTNGPVDDYFATVLASHVYKALSGGATASAALRQATGAMKAAALPPIYLFYSLVGRPCHTI